MPAIFRWSDFLKTSDGWRFTKATTEGKHYVQVSVKKSVTSVGCVFFKPLSNLLSSTGRRPPVKSVVLAKRVAEGVDGDDEHAQLDEVLQPQPQLGAAGQAAGALALFGKPPGSYKHVF